jgi:hypothetical protein
MKEKSAPPKIELHPDAWERFERAAGVVAKSPPQHRIKPSKNKRALKGRAGSKTKAPIS